jgi:hypothetical protein
MLAPLPSHGAKRLLGPRGRFFVRDDRDGVVPTVEESADADDGEQFYDLSVGEVIVQRDMVRGTDGVRHQSGVAGESQRDPLGFREWRPWPLEVPQLTDGVVVGAEEMQCVSTVRLTVSGPGSDTCNDENLGFQPILELSGGKYHSCEWQKGTVHFRPGSHLEALAIAVLRHRGRLPSFLGGEASSCLAGSDPGLARDVRSESCLDR